MLELSYSYPGGPVLIQDISDRQNIPLKYLQQILLDLKQAGFLVSRKGPGGGYSLARGPESITLGQVLTAMDGTVIDMGCSLTAKNPECGCPHPSSCAIREALVEMSAALLKMMDEISFADLRDKQRLADQGRTKVLDYII